MRELEGGGGQANCIHNYTEEVKSLGVKHFLHRCQSLFWLLPNEAALSFCKGSLWGCDKGEQQEEDGAWRTFLLATWLIVVDRSHRSLFFNELWTLTFDYLFFFCPDIYKEGREQKKKKKQPKGRNSWTSATTSKGVSPIGGSPLTSASEWAAITCVRRILPTMLV